VREKSGNECPVTENMRSDMGEHELHNTRVLE
jgi:hypothetical protein